VTGRFGADAIRPCATARKITVDWQPDIDRSVSDYNDWYLENAPKLWVQARGRAVEAAAEAIDITGGLPMLHPEAMQELLGS